MYCRLNQMCLESAERMQEKVSLAGVKMIIQVWENHFRCDLSPSVHIVDTSYTVVEPRYEYFLKQKRITSVSAPSTFV